MNHTNTHTKGKPQKWVKFTQLNEYGISYLVNSLTGNWNKTITGNKTTPSTIYHPSMVKTHFHSHCSATTGIAFIESILAFVSATSPRIPFRQINVEEIAHTELHALRKTLHNTGKLSARNNNNSDNDDNRNNYIKLLKNNNIRRF